MASHDLLPCRCPFCGVSPDLYGGDQMVKHPIRDKPCPLEGFGFAIDEWNTRAAETELREALKEASKLVECAFNGTLGAPQALDAIDDLAKAALSNTGASTEGDTK